MSVLGKRLLAVLYLGGWIFALFIALVCVLSQAEFYKLSGFKDIIFIVGLILGGLLPLIAHYYPPTMLWFIIIGFLIITLIIPYRGLQNVHNRFGIALSGIIYPSLFLSCFVLIRDGEWGDKLHSALVIFFIFSTVWICDTAAYAGGKAFGRHKMAPIVSPHKTWEGAISGAIVAFIWTILCWSVLKPTLNLVECFVGALIVVTVGQIGDLSESVFKRRAGLKDSGNFLGPHGGVLDRFDSLITVAPAFWLYFLALGKM
jgi:phosphatidate cytidylyltransferase